MNIAALGTRPIPEKNKFETFAWKFMRWSGVLLIPLIFGHLAYMHLVNSVAVIEGAEWVRVHRWSYLNVRIYDAFVLWFAALHGFNGLRTVINDYVRTKAVNRLLIFGSGGLLVIVLTLGSLALIAPNIPGFAEGIPIESFWGGWIQH